MTPWARQIYKQRQENDGKDRPSACCLPHSVTDFDAHSRRGRSFSHLRWS